MFQHLETLQSAFDDLSRHGSPMTDLQKFDALIISLPQEMEESKTMYCAWAEADQTFETVAEKLCDGYVRSFLVNRQQDRQHQSNSDMFDEARSKDRHSNEPRDSSRSQSPINMVHGSSFMWDESDRSHFSEPLKNHDNLTLIDAEESSFDEHHEMITNFASFPGFTALNSNVERPSKLRLENALTQAANRPIEPMMDRGKLPLKPKLENLFIQAANASFEQIKFSSNNVISRKCLSLKKKTQQLASAVFKIPNKEQGFRRKKSYSSFLCSDQAPQVLTARARWVQASRKFRLLMSRKFHQTFQLRNVQLIQTL